MSTERPLINKNGWRILDLRRSGNGPPLLAGDGLLFAPTKAKSRSGVAVSRVALGFLAAAEAEDGVQQKSVPLISRHADLFTSGRAPLLITRCAELKGSIRESCSLTGELIELRRYDHLNSHLDLLRRCSGNADVPAGRARLEVCGRRLG